MPEQVSFELTERQIAIYLDGDYDPAKTYDDGPLTVPESWSMRNVYPHNMSGVILPVFESLDSDGNLIKKL